MGRNKSKKTILRRIQRGKYCCPFCGHTKTKVVDHHVGYPEVWIETFCVNCNKYVGGADNSPYRLLTDSMKGVRSYKDILKITRI